MYAAPSTRTTGETADSPPGSQTLRPRGSARRPAASALRAVAAASSAMPSWSSVQRERLLAAGLQVDRRQTSGVDPIAARRGHGGLVEAPHGDSGDGHAVAGLVPRGRLQHGEAGDRDERR